MQTHRLRHLASLRVVAARTSVVLVPWRLEQAVRLRLKRILAGAMPPAALAVCAIALAGCGSSAKPSSSASAGTQALTFANCMRSNGLTKYPDPSSNGHPQPLNQIDPNSPTFLRAYTACRKYVPNGGSGPPAPTATQARAALAFAQCMRNHGLPQFPDPLTTYGPGFTLGEGKYFPNISTTELQSPAFTHAAKTCGVKLP